MVKRKFVLQDGTVVDYLPEDLLKKFQQKVIDYLTPLVYQAVVNEHLKEQRKEEVDSVASVYQ